MAQLPNLFGATANTCASAANCTSSDVVEAMLSTQSVLVFLVSVCLFSFGFYVGQRMALGNKSMAGDA